MAERGRCLHRRPQSGVRACQGLADLRQQTSAKWRTAVAGERSVRVAICDRASSYRRGLGAAFGAAGYVVEEVDDVRVQPLVSGVNLALFTVRSSSDWQV